MEKNEISIQDILLFRETINEKTGLFSGSALIDFLSKNNSKSLNSRSEIVESIKNKFSNPNATDQLIYPLKIEGIFEDKSNSQYRFIQDEFSQYAKDPKVLNLFQIETEEHFFYEYKDTHHRPQGNISAEIKELMSEIYATFLSEDGSLVDYSNLTKSKVFKENYLPLIKKLAFADLSGLVSNDDEIKAFFINIYNALNIHAHCKEIEKDPNFKKTVLNMGSFYSSWKYCIGGHLYSLDDIEHGVLRKNNGKSSIWDVICSRVKERWSINNPRRKFVVKTLDPRIHFTLNCGAKSCPPISAYDSKEIEKQLEVATRGFMRTTVKLEENTGRYKIIISKLLDWYKADFGKNEAEVMKFVLKYLKDDDNKKRIVDLLETDRKKVSLSHKKST